MKDVMASCFILLPFHIFYRNLLYFVVIWVYFPRFCMLYQEKSGNPGRHYFALKERFRQLESTYLHM
jgi:hypothetical protein